MIPGFKPTFVDFLKDTIGAIRACFSKINLRSVAAQMPSTQKCMVSRGEVGPEEKYAVIRKYVLRNRAHCGIIALGRTRRPELSCEAMGEFYNLVERQLLTTEEGFGSWLELSHPSILDGAYRYVAEGIRR